MKIRNLTDWLLAKRNEEVRIWLLQLESDNFELAMESLQEQFQQGLLQ